MHTLSIQTQANWLTIAPFPDLYADPTPFQLELDGVTKKVTVQEGTSVLYAAKAVSGWESFDRS